MYSDYHNDPHSWYLPLPLVVFQTTVRGLVRTIRTCLIPGRSTECIGKKASCIGDAACAFGTEILFSATPKWPLWILH